MSNSLRPTLITLALVTVVTLIWGLSQTRAEQSELDRSAIEKIIKEYLVENPEVVIDALDAFEAKQMAKRQQALDDGKEIVSTLISKPGNELTDDGFSFAMGNNDADITIVEFFDYNCGYCRKTLPVLAQLIGEDPKIRVVFKEWPILRGSGLAERASLASKFQNKYWEFHQALMQSGSAMSPDLVFQLAKDVGLDVDKLKADMERPDIDEILDRNAELARKIGFSGTPAMVIGDQVAPGYVDIDELKQIVDEARSNRKS